MPCSDGRDNNVRYIRETVTDPKLVDRVKYLEGCLCALITEIIKNNCQNIITDAEINGDIDIKSFYGDHTTEDMRRLRHKIIGMSNHELDLLKKLIDLNNTDK